MEYCFVTEVQRDSGDLLTDSEDTSPYIPTRKYREGIKISCIDESHINYPGSKMNIIRWTHVIPQYIEFKTVNVSSILTLTLTLYCDDFLSSPGLRHIWFYNGVEYERDKENITLDTSSLKNDDKIEGWAHECGWCDPLILAIIFLPISVFFRLNIFNPSEGWAHECSGCDPLILPIIYFPY